MKDLIEARKKDVQSFVRMVSSADELKSPSDSGFDDFAARG